jgi:predicted RecA/RadA family phage recombinase
MADFSTDGKTIRHLAASAITAGDVIVVGEKVCVAKHDIANGAYGTLSVQGSFEFPVDGATAFAAGAKVYWDVADQEATEDADTGTNKLIGYVTEAALAADVLCKCYLVNNVA